MLGTGVPSALGAKLGSPERDVVCVTGDGAAGFHFMGSPVRRSSASGPIARPTSASRPSRACDSWRCIRDRCDSWPAALLGVAGQDVA